MNNINDTQKGKNILEIIDLEGGKIRLRISQSHKTEPLAPFVEHKIDLKDIESSIREINSYLRMGNIFRNNGPEFFPNFKKACEFLHNELFSLEIKSSLHDSPNKYLEFILDAQLLHIPWELLFDGERFLCERFNIGRKIRIEEKEINHSRDFKEITLPLKMLILADPTDDLDMAHEEGKRINKMINKFQKGQKLIISEFYASEMITKVFIKKNLTDFDIIHYAGHVEYDSARPQKSGWILSDGILYADDIIKMINASAKRPCLIFVNACQSGNVPKKQSDSETPTSYPCEGLVYAFLKLGVKCYIGTFSELSDEYGGYMGEEFYYHLLRGKRIGESLRSARESFQQRFSKKSLAWINYMLYGDPEDYIVPPIDPPPPPPPPQPPPPQPPPPQPEKGIRNPFSKFDRKWFWPFLFFLSFLSFLTFSYQIKNGHRKKDIGDPNVQFVIDIKDKKVKELMISIHEKLKERKEKQPSLEAKIPQTDMWTSKSQTIALFEILYTPGQLPDWVKGYIMHFRRKLAKRCNEGKRFRVVERDELDKLLKEFDLDLVDLPLEENQYKNALIEFLFAEKMLFLEVFKSGDDVCLWYKLDDVRKGESIKMGSLILTNKEDISVLTERIYEQIEKIIHVKFPLRGRIKKIRHSIATLNIGTDVGVKKGDIFEVFADPNIAEEKKKRIARIEVMDDGLDPKEVQCKILIGDDLSIGQRVEISKNNLD